MLFLPSKNPPLCNLEVLVLVWLLGIMLPGPVEGLQCYSCSGGRQCREPTRSELKDCPGAAACFSLNVGESMIRGCSSAIDTCRAQAIGTECYNQAEQNGTTAWANCRAQHPETEIPEEGNICWCEETRCNSGSADPAGLKCYACQSRSALGCERRTIIKRCKKGEHCWGQVYRGHIQKGCLDGAHGKCLKDKYGGCVSVDRKNIAEVEVTMSQCSKSSHWYELYSDNKGLTITNCQCDTELCTLTGLPDPNSGRRLVAFSKAATIGSAILVLLSTAKIY